MVCFDNTTLTKRRIHHEGRYRNQKKKPEGNVADHLTEILRQGCARILKEALEVEIENLRRTRSIEELPFRILIML